MSWFLKRVQPGVVVAAMLVLSACGGDEVAVPTGDDPKSVSERMIITDLTPNLGLGLLTPACQEPGPLTIGMHYECTATAATGKVVEIVGTVNDAGHLELATSNLITPRALLSYERDAAAALNNSVGSNFTAESVDCGDGPIVFEAATTMNCALVMPASGQVFDLTFDVTDIDRRHFGLAVSDQPRPISETETEEAE